MNGDRDKRNEDEELEALLRGLVPNPLDVGFVASLHREREQAVSGLDQSPSRIQWGRVIPLTLVCTVVMFLSALHRYGDRLGQEASAGGQRTAGTTTPAGAPVNATAAVAESPGLPTPDSRFVPVSSHGTIMNTSSGGLIETEHGPRQRLNIEYRDAYHWHDPESGTNIRFFRPRSEEVIVPLPSN
jgi:hypothetical protein